MIAIDSGEGASGSGRWNFIRKNQQNSQVGLSKGNSATEIKTECNQSLKDQLSRLSFSENTIPDIPSAGSSSSRPANVHGLIYFI